MNEIDQLVEGPNPDINAIGAQRRKLSWKVMVFVAVCLIVLAGGIVLAMKLMAHKAASFVEPPKKEVPAPPPPKGSASFGTDPSLVNTKSVDNALKIPGTSSSKKCEESVLLDKSTGRPVKDINGTTVMVDCQGVVVGTNLQLPSSSPNQSQETRRGDLQPNKLLDRYGGDISLTSNPTTAQGTGIKASSSVSFPAMLPAPPSDAAKTIMEQLQRMNSSGGQSPSSSLVNGSQQQAANSQGPVGNNLSGANTPKAIASRTIDENRVISKGAQIDCALTTRLVTDISGFASCIVTSNVYSANGRTLLIERMSEVQGEYGASGQAGQRRVFVLWTRIRMPGGVTIDLNSPSTDALGAAGMDGVIDNRWYERIGSAYMLSFFKDIMAYEIARNTTTNTSSGATVLQNTTQASSSLAEKVLSQSINIKPTLYANQGDRVAIYVARDLEFREIYDVVKSKQ